MATAKLRFHEMLRELRENAAQTNEVMAVLLNMDEQEYLSMEEGLQYPDNETLKRLCMVAEWNYYDTQRMIINEMGGPAPIPGGGEAAMQALQSIPLESTRPNRAKTKDTLGNRLKEVRLRTGQTVDIIAMLLNISPDDYRSLEAGGPPGDDLLRRISIIYDWNYHDLLSLLRSEQASSLQPRRPGAPFSPHSANHGQMKSILGELEGLFTKLQGEEQQFILSQLELVRDTMRNMQKAS